jgi:hypothetical protein
MLSKRKKYKNIYDEIIPEFKTYIPKIRERIKK